MNAPVARPAGRPRVSSRQRIVTGGGDEATGALRCGGAVGRPIRRRKVPERGVGRVVEVDESRGGRGEGGTGEDEASRWMTCAARMPVRTAVAPKERRRLPVVQRMVDGDGGPCTGKEGGDATEAVWEDMKASGVTTGEEAMTDKEWTASGDTKTLSSSEGLTASGDMKTLSSSEVLDVTVSTKIGAGWLKGNGACGDADGACEDADGACKDAKDLREPRGDGT